MVGALAMVGSSVESHICPCLCVDSLSLSNANFKSTVDLGVYGNSVSKKHSRKLASLELSSSFVDSPGQNWRLLGARGHSRKQRKNVSLVIVNELGGQYDDSFEDVKMQIQNYFTYKAVRTVLNQLYEMNPPQYRWLYNFVAANKPGDGKRFIRTLGKEKQDLAERVMVTRLHLYGKWIKVCCTSSKNVIMQKFIKKYLIRTWN
ncbi:chaperonin-like RbcX protein 2, chloroplastic isoform X2 [Aristolochia californica]|uniref:chaperonin-like RbcX protein 2, chloroplastic isoform X2 n=1 Tax=Aristolochia californica TaxID=171875 RepID=UPI0035E02860